MHKFRIYFLVSGVFLFGIFLIINLFFVQILDSEKYLAKAERQYIQRNYHLYDRGEIYFENKDNELVSAATLQSGYLVSINPKYIENPESTYTKLSSLIDLDREYFMSLLERGGDYREIASGLDDDLASEIEKLSLPGVSLYSERWRFYPGSSMASHVLGLVGFQGDDYGGRYGLESFYEDVLERPDNSYKVNFFAKLFGNVAMGFSDDEENKKEGSVITTIEPMVQSFLEYELKRASEKWKARSIGGIIMDPKTGEIKAMALLPDFNPNNFSSASSVNVFSNSLIESVYEMGSVMKPLTVAAGLDSGVIEPDSTYYDAGRVLINGYTISNFDGKGNGTVSMQDVLNRSINTGVVHIVKEMGSDLFADYLLSFGFDSKTGIDLPYESENLLDNLESPRMVEYATASFGQGIAVTPISMIRALAVLGNGGFVVEPHIVKRVDFKNGESVEIEKNLDKKERVISKETSKEISRMLVNTVDEALMNGSVSLPRHSIAAKTGTAQIASSGERGYRDDAFLHSFFGYFPAYDPEFIIFLYHVEPKGAQYASQTLTNSFMEIVKFLIQYHGINPDR